MKGQKEMKTKSKRDALRLAEQKQLCIECPMILHRLDACGLHATARLMNEVVRRIGWEVAGHPGGAPTPAQGARLRRKACTEILKSLKSPSKK